MPKKTRSATYYHVSAVPRELHERMERASLAAKYPAFTVVKFHREKVSLLDYPTFWAEAHPALSEAWTVNLVTGKCKHTRYKPSTAPILHRKELFVNPKVEIRYGIFAELTRLEEQEGLLDDPPGRRNAWHEFVEDRGYLIVDHTLYKAVK
jgi:hypothetical protein